MNPGTVLGPFRIERLLGAGGMGEVYAAEDTENGRTLAVKVLSQRLAEGTERARFIREGQLAASISHPNVVYVYGSDEIDGVPVIAMELLPGGTLKDRLEQRGPMATGEAVDAILQVIAGLQAAHAVGVLHRDVKPANCFVSADGSTKIGDFGLSISTATRDDTRLTLAGSIHGTPAFAAPEQLWGQPLDVRADIYGVGATLHCLLTGKPPFEAANLMALLRAIEHDPAPPIRSLQPRVPRGLAAIVARCLAKSPDGRYAHYAALQDALEPFRSAAPTPAVIGRRVVAFAVDTVLLTGLVFPIQVLASALVDSSPGSLPPLIRAATDLMMVVYFGIAEGLWGASVGKAALRLRVVGMDGATPGLARAAVRALGFYAFNELFIVPELLEAAEPMRRLASTLSVALPFLAFVTARRRNGFAGVHELLSGTRVRVPRDQPVMLVGAAPVPPQQPYTAARLGPFEVDLATDRDPREPVVVRGYDQRLKRRLWIRVLPLSTPPLPVERRELSESGRPRWVAGRRTSTESWDAFEFVEGQPLLSLGDAQPWSVVRAWLADLAHLVTSERARATLPPLNLEQVWIGRDGRPWLLDWPSIAREPAPGDVHPMAPAKFLAAVARFGTKEAAPLPLAAAQAIEQLGSTEVFAAAQAVAVRQSLAGASEVTRLARAVHMICVAFVPALFLLIPTIMALSLELRARWNPEPERLRRLMARLESVERRRSDSTGRAQRDALLTYLREHRDAVHRLAVEPNRGIERSGVEAARALEQRLTTMPAPTRAQVQAAEHTLGPILADDPSVVFAGDRVPLAPFVILVLAGVAASSYRGGGFMLRRLGLAVVHRDGRLASVPIVALRSALAWAPVVTAAAAATYAERADSSLSRWTMTVAAVAAATVAVVGIVVAIRRPERGLQDRLLGTWIVPR